MSPPRGAEVRDLAGQMQALSVRQREDDVDAVPSGARAPTDSRMPPWEMFTVYTLRSASQVGSRTSTSERAVMRGALRRSEPPFLRCRDWCHSG